MSRIRLLHPGILALFVLVMALAIPSGASAAKPVITTIPIDVTFFDEGASADCGFPIEFHVTGTLRIHQTFDETGTVVVEEKQTFSNWVQTYTNLDTGTSISSRSPSVVRLFFHEDGSFTVKVTGLSLAAIVPGEGVVFLDVGHIELFFESQDDFEPDIVFQAGQQDDIALACAALA
jgi:hypothetical protein